MKSDKKVERRGYFRIQDSIGLSYSILGGTDDPAQGGSGDMEMPLANLLAEIDIQFNQAENALWRENATTAQALGLLNRKISLLAARQLQEEGRLLDSYEELQASISGCGMAFPCSQPVAEGTRLRVSVVLRPSNIDLHFTARVIACEELADLPKGHYLMRISIDEEHQAAREQLVQHVVQRQFVPAQSIDTEPG